MNKIECFQEELALIKNDRIYNFAKAAIELMPDYFWSISASSTSKYHPKYALGEGGLLRHTKAAVRIMYELYRLDWWHFTNDEMDLMLVALILHDGWKSGKIQGKYSVTEHPLIAAQEIATLMENEWIKPEQVQFVCDCIARHMGQFVFDHQGNQVLQRPENKFQKATHLADYLASRKILEVNFDAELSKS